MIRNINYIEILKKGFYRVVLLTVCVVLSLYYRSVLFYWTVL